MTTDENSTLAGNKPRGEKEKSGRQRGQKKEKAKPPTKIIIRHLPPTMSEEEFLKQIDPLPDHDFYYWVGADWSLGYDATCRAYLTLRHYDDVFLFRDRFDGYVFVDTLGAEYPAIVEFAPFQGPAKNKSRRSDNKVNTIDQEPHYQQFLDKIEEDREAAIKGGETKLEFTLDRKKEEKITSTPLLQYLANKKEKRREEAKKRSEEKRRQAQQQQHKVTKIISNQESAGSIVGGGVKRRDAKAASSSPKDEIGEEKKTSRLKRRAERNQRRREAHEQRILDRDRERKEKGGTSGEAEQSDGSKTDLKQPESQQQHQRKSDESKQRKDSKKSSDKRERDRDRERDRNRNRKDKEKSKPREATSTSTLVSADRSAERYSKKAKEGEINDTVMSFIRSVATTKESDSNVRKPEEVLGQHQESNAAKDIVSKPTNSASNGEEGLNDVKENKLIMSQSGKKSGNDSGSATMTEDERQRQKQRAADEQRRIRNKDRPSIAIYQPKIRQRQSEERDVTAEHKDVRSNPTSDCESVKKEENCIKKVSRYSERRSERRAAANREKVKSDDISSTQMHVLRNSSSIEQASEAAKRSDENSET